MKTAIIKLDKVKKSFNGNYVLNGISLELYSGEIFGIIGTSGSGKTTLLNTIIGFLSCSSGDVLFKHNELGYKPVYHHLDKVKKMVGFAAQVPSFYEELTVFENLDYFGCLYSLSAEARLTNINTLLELVELEGARNLIAKNLSGGMQRRLDMACALVHNPEILILDEPTSDLDPMLGSHIWKLAKKINKRGTTIILASHDLSEIENVCTRFGILLEGKLKHVGTFHELSNMLSKGQEVHVETYPGNYEKILARLTNPVILEKENRGNEIVLLTKKPEKVLHEILNVLSNLDETLIDIRVARLRLSDIFSKITKK